MKGSGGSKEERDTTGRDIKEATVTLITIPIILLDEIPENGNKRKNQKVTCIHHWHIESDRGHDSVGVCRICHEVKVFKNVAPAYSYNQRLASDRLTAFEKILKLRNYRILEY
jgi:hypothetical protein